MWVHVWSFDLQYSTTLPLAFVHTVEVQIVYRTASTFTHAFLELHVYGTCHDYSHCHWHERVAKFGLDCRLSGVAEVAMVLWVEGRTEAHASCRNHDLLD